MSKLLELDQDFTAQWTREPYSENAIGVPGINTPARRLWYLIPVSYCTVRYWYRYHKFITSLDPPERRSWHLARPVARSLHLEVINRHQTARTAWHTPTCAAARHVRRHDSTAYWGARAAARVPPTPNLKACRLPRLPRVETPTLRASVPQASGEKCVSVVPSSYWAFEAIA